MKPTCIDRDYFGASLGPIRNMQSFCGGCVMEVGCSRKWEPRESDPDACPDETLIFRSPVRVGGSRAVLARLTTL